MSEQKQITITADGGNITISPTSVLVNLGDTVTWNVMAESFLLTFADGQAFDRTQIDAETPPVTARKRGVFHYSVALAIGKRVFADAGCPTVIIR